MSAPDPTVDLHHRDGIPWWSAPLPRLLHRCSAQTPGYVNHFRFVERCACGAIRVDGGRWMERNRRANRARV